MLTRKQNLFETMNGGNPDRFVNQYEAFEIIRSAPVITQNPSPKPGDMNVVNAWGVTRSWPEGMPGAFPVHDAEHIVCKDITKWRDTVKMPNVEFPDEMWEQARADIAKVDRDDKLVLAFCVPGVFEQTHYLLEIQNCLMNFYLEPEAMHELIDYITEYELKVAEQYCKHLDLDGVFHHDDWGSQISTFISPEMFEEFLLPAYKKIYGYYKDHGAKFIVHHSDSYAATLVPYMIEMGIDVWQGVMNSNDIPALIKEYGGKITFMGGIDSASIDTQDWTPENIEEQVRKTCTACGKHYFIPSASQGLPVSTYAGVYDATSEKIDLISKELF